MILRSMEAHRYRSLRAIRLDLGSVTVFTGGNGAGKSNLYKALRLLQAAAQGTLSREILAEGGMPSILWSGRWLRDEARQVRLACALCDEERALDYHYEIELGLPPPVSGAFPFEPQVKRERLSVTLGRRPAILLDRDRALVRLRDDHGRLSEIDAEVLPSETALSVIGDDGRSPEIAAFRRMLGGWRFYHGLRTDEAAPIRQPSPAATAPLLAEDGANLAAVFATLAHIREDRADLDRVVAAALAGARLEIPLPESEARFSVSLPDVPGRLFSPRELSDGQIRFLALCGALLSYRHPPLIALNEPETSLHPDMLEPLADLVALAARRSQLWVVTHSEKLAAAIAARTGQRPERVEKTAGETRVVGRGLDGSAGAER